MQDAFWLTQQVAVVSLATPDNKLQSFPPQVVATELAKASVVAARHNMEANGVTNIFLARMSSEEFVETWRVKGTRNRLAGLDWEQLNLKTLLVDPPR